MTGGREAEAAGKLALVRSLIGERAAARFKGIDWFAWITAGGSSAVLLAAETGIAEVVVGPDEAWVVTDEIEAQRLADEELPRGFAVRATPWAEPARREILVRELTRGCEVLSDRPSAGEGALPAGVVAAKRRLGEAELERYRQVGRVAAEAMTEALTGAAPDWSEGRLAGAGAAALLARGLEPALIMAAGERRLQLYRHPVTREDPLGGVAMMVFCARGRGLYANLTRFVSFGSLSPPLRERHRQVLEIEARALGLCRPGVGVAAVYRELAAAYREKGYPAAISEHHQGGTTGYLSREVVATPESRETLEIGAAVAWNPSLRGAKVEDTFAITASGLVNLTADPAWPAVEVAGRLRPAVLER